MGFTDFLDPIFAPLLDIDPLLAIVSISFFISLLITIVYKYTTDQNLMKSLKEEMKAFQKQIKELRSNPEKAMEVQKEAMKTNMKYMMQSFKSTLYSFIPIILIFGWMTANFAFDPIVPGEEFVTIVTFERGITGDVSISPPDEFALLSDRTKEIAEGAVSWTLTGVRGEYVIEYDYEGTTYSKSILVSDENRYGEVKKNVNDGRVQEIEVKHQKKIVFLGMGWLFTYIVFSIIFSLLIRKYMRVY